MHKHNTINIFLRIQIKIVPLTLIFRMFWIQLWQNTHFEFSLSSFNVSDSKIYGTTISIYICAIWRFAIKLYKHIPSLVKRNCAHILLQHWVTKLHILFKLWRYIFIILTRSIFYRSYSLGGETCRTGPYLESLLKNNWTCNVR